MFGKYFKIVLLVMSMMTIINAMSYISIDSVAGKCDNFQGPKNDTTIIMSYMVSCLHRQRVNLRIEGDLIRNRKKFIPNIDCDQTKYEAMLLKSMGNITICFDVHLKKGQILQRQRVLYTLNM